MRCYTFVELQNGKFHAIEFDLDSCTASALVKVDWTGTDSSVDKKLEPWVLRLLVVFSRVEKVPKLYDPAKVLPMRHLTIVVLFRILIHRSSRQRFLCLATATQKTLVALLLREKLKQIFPQVLDLLF
jgi:hypothetical protein